MKSHILAANTLTNINVSVGQSKNTTTNESKTCLKHGRPIGIKDKTHRNRKVQIKQIGALEEVIPTEHTTRAIDPSKIYVQDYSIIESFEAESFKKLSPEDELLKSYPLKRKIHLKITRSRYIM